VKAIQNPSDMTTAEVIQHYEDKITQAKSLRIEKLRAFKQLGADDPRAAEIEDDIQQIDNHIAKQRKKIKK
jgi:hypothetical protein